VDPHIRPAGLGWVYFFSFQGAVYIVDLNSMIMFLPLVQSKSVVILRACFGFCAFLILGFSPGTCFPTSFSFINLKPFPSLLPLSFFLSLLAVIFRFLGFKQERYREGEMLYLIGLGLGDEKDITLRGLEAVKKCEKVYMEAYTSLLSFGLSTDGLSTLVITLFFFFKL
jgi:hypothetical protein